MITYTHVQPLVEHEWSTCTHWATNGAEGNRHSLEIQGKAELYTAVRNTVRQYQVVGECMIELTWKDFSEEVIVELSSEGRAGVGREVGRSMSTKSIVGIGTHMCRGPKGAQCDQSIGV